MKKNTLHPAAPLIAVLLGLPALLPAASFTEATVTRLDKDVKILKENSAPRAAATGDKVFAVSSVATGPSSRAELKFPDGSLTRLGANSRFTLRGQGHTVELDKGVLLFEVPEKLRDAKVRTAAVTAAVTGGTVITEFLPGGFIKIIVVEGTVDLFLNNKPSEFLTMHAGQMLIQPVGSQTMGIPVDIDLKRLLKTSKLLNAEDEPNAKEIKDALNQQQGEINDGNLVQTNLVIPGLGTMVQLTNDARFDIIPGFGVRNNNQGNNNGPPGGGGGGTQVVNNSQNPFQGAIPLIQGTHILDNQSYVKTEPPPQITTTLDTIHSSYFSPTSSLVTSDGAVYNASKDGPFPYFGFGSTKPADPAFQSQLNDKETWAAYKFENLLIRGTPDFDIPNVVAGSFTAFSPYCCYTDNTIHNVIISAVNNITASAVPTIETASVPTSNVFDTSFSALENFALYSQNGSITVSDGFKIEGNGQNYSLVAAGPTSDVTIQGDLCILNGSLLISAGQNVQIDGAKVTADNGMTINAAKNIHITNSAQLKALASLDDATLLQIASSGGDITIDNGSNLEAGNINIQAQAGNISVLDSTLIAAHTLKMRTLKPDGTLLIGNSTLRGGATAGDLIRLYAEGSSGKVQFQGNVTLDGNLVQIAGKTVQVDPGSTVNVVKGSSQIFADQHNYNSGSGPGLGVGFGTISGTVTKSTFSARPSY